MPLPVTYAQIVAATGTSKATVSRALRNDPRISEATKAKIVKAAAKLGYRPDPSLAVLAAYRNRKRAPGDHGKVAVLNAWGVARERELPLFFQQQLTGIRERTSQLGYQIELFRTPHDPHGQQRLGRVLAARGIRGVVIGPLPVDVPTLDMDWSLFASAAVGLSLTSPALHHAVGDQAWAVNTIYTRLRGMGYARVGYCSDVEGELRGRHQALSVYLKCLYLDGRRQDEFPPLLLETKPQADPGAWAKRNRLDAVICGGTHLPFVVSKLKASGLSIPGDIAVAVISLPDKDERHAGIRVDMASLGRAAVSLLHNMLVNGERGVPEQRHVVLVQGGWQQGRTVASGR